MSFPCSRLAKIQPVKPIYGPEALLSDIEYIAFYSHGLGQECQNRLKRTLIPSRPWGEGEGGGGAAEAAGDPAGLPRGSPRLEFRGCPPKAVKEKE